MNATNSINLINPTTPKFAKMSTDNTGQYKALSQEFKDDQENVICAGSLPVVEFTCSFDNLNAIKSHAFFNSPVVGQYTLTDGTMIRVYYHNDHWRTATNKCLDANLASFENVKSFGELFENVAKHVGLDYTVLDKTKTYMYVLRDICNRIVSPVFKPELIHTCTVDNLTGETTFSGHTVENFTTIEDTIKDLTKIDDWTFQGLLLANADGKLMKLEAPQYKYVRELKGNMSSRGKNWKLSENVHPSSFRLLQIIREKKEQEFLYYFPEYKNALLVITHELMALSNRIYNEYVHVHIHRDTQVSEEFINFLKRIHYLYTQTKQRITTELVLEVVKECPMYKMMQLLGYIN